MTLWRALLEGIGWRVGKQVAEEAMADLRKAVEPEPEEDPAVVARRLEVRARETAKKLERDRKEAEKRARDQAREVERELAALKKQVDREKK